MLGFEATPLCHSGTAAISVGIVDSNAMYGLGVKAAIDRLDLACSVDVQNGVTAHSSLQNAIPAVLIVSDTLMPSIEATLSSLPRAGWALIVTLRGCDSRYLKSNNEPRPDALIWRDATEARFRECLEAVISGKTWLDSGLSNISLGNAKRSWHSLSKRELEVALLASRGLCNKEIARSLKVSNGTIKSHFSIHSVRHIDRFWAGLG